MKGICIDAEFSSTLQAGVEYFLFQAKPNHFYVSRFENMNAHCGCYAAERFKVIEVDMWGPEPEVQIPRLDSNILYTAQLIWRTKGYKDKPLKEYVIQPRNTHCFFWRDRECTKFCGSFPLQWFRNFTPVDKETLKKEEMDPFEGVTFFEGVDGQLSFC